MSITNPTGIKFSNEKIRRAADQLAKCYYFAKSLVDEWYSTNMGSIITVDGGTIEDGSETDGRNVITGNDATNVVVRCTELIADFEANNKAKLNTVNKVAVNRGL